MFAELADKVAWSQHNYSKKFEQFWDFKDNVDRIIEPEVASDEFIRRYEKPYIPVIIKAVQNDWKAQHKWTIEVIFTLLFIILKYLISNANSIIIPFHLKFIEIGKKISKSKIQMWRG
jgi:hypothetical protein